MQPESKHLTHLLQTIGREEIKITDIKLTPLTYQPSDGSYVHECGPIVMTKYDVGIFEIFTDQGFKGIGPGPVESSQDYTQWIGKNPFDLVALGVRGGVNVAAWDIIGKVKGLTCIPSPRN